MRRSLRSKPRTNRSTTSSPDSSGNAARSSRPAPVSGKTRTPPRAPGTHAISSRKIPGLDDGLGSSVIIDYLDGRDDAINYGTNNIQERAVAPPLVLFEVYQGEVFKSGPADFDAVDGALEWLVIIDETPALARTAAELQDRLATTGRALSARDAFIAGAAKELGERLAVADTDFDVAGLTDELEIDVV